MKEYLLLLAKYNAHVNRELYAIIARLEEAQRVEEVGSYFKSVFGLLNHLYSSDCGWLLRFNENLGPYPVLDVPELAGPLPPRGAPMFKDFEALKARRPALDAVVERFVGELSEADLAKSFTFTLRAGGERTLVCWQALAHMFNHETHHWGAIAQILDEMGVENDYSNLMSIL